MNSNDTSSKKEKSKPHPLSLMDCGRWLNYQGTTVCLVSGKTPTSMTFQTKKTKRFWKIMSNVPLLELSSFLMQLSRRQANLNGRRIEIQGTRFFPLQR